MKKGKEKSFNVDDQKYGMNFVEEDKTSLKEDDQTMEEQYAMKAKEEMSVLQEDNIMEEPKISVGIFKVAEQAKLPVYSTLGSRCFDIFAYFDGNTTMKAYTAYNEIEKHAFKINTSNGVNWAIYINPGERILIPTGLIFDIPRGFSMLLRPRSGISTKRGLTLVNAVGVVDWDYKEEVFIPIVNVGNAGQQILCGERLCQGEIVKDPTRADFVLKEFIKTNVTDRVGGFGSTGTN